MIEPLALDEAFLDVTENKKNIPLAVDVAREIKKEIKTSMEYERETLSLLERAAKEIEE